MPDVAYNGHKVVLKRGTNATTDKLTDTYETVGWITSEISGPGMSKNVHTLRPHGTGADSDWMRKLAGGRDAGAIGFTLGFKADDPIHLKLLADYNSMDSFHYQLAPPKEGLPAFYVDGIVKTFNMGNPEDGIITAQVEIDIDGKPEFV
jgi:hypothetical protein